MRKNALPLVILLLLAFTGALAYPLLPSRMVVHWDATGTPDGFASKDVGALLVPILALALFGFFLVLPSLDPEHRGNIERFRRFYDGMVSVILAFLLYVHLVLLAASLGYVGDPFLALVPAIAALLYYLGVVLEHAKRNWFIGVRTPWTLSSEKVWDETNTLAGVLFKGAGAVALFGVAAPRHAAFFMLVPVVFAAAYSILYSYLAWRRIHRHPQA
jgi:uncharacterized membrane protein